MVTNGLSVDDPVYPTVGLPPTHPELYQWCRTTRLRIMSTRENSSGTVTDCADGDDAGTDCTRGPDQCEDGPSELAAEIESLESRVAELEAATEALRGYAGSVRSVNRAVERRADRALATAEELRRRLDGGPTAVDGAKPGVDGGGSTAVDGVAPAVDGEFEPIERPRTDPIDET